MWKMLLSGGLYEAQNGDDEHKVMVGIIVRGVHSAMRGLSMSKKNDISKRLKKIIN